MNGESTGSHDVALQASAAAVAAQHAAVTEQEIRLGQVRDQFIAEQRTLMADVEAIILHLLAQEEHLQRRQAEMRSRESFVIRLENACARLARELDLVRNSLATETNDARPRIRAA